MFLCLPALIPQTIISAKTNNSNSEEEEVDFRANKNPANDGTCWMNDDFGGHSYNGCDNNDNDNKEINDSRKEDIAKNNNKKWTKSNGLGDDKIYVDFNNWDLQFNLKYSNSVYFNTTTIEHFSKKDYELKPLYDLLTLIISRKDSYTYCFLTFDMIYRNLLISFVKNETAWLKTSTLENKKKYHQSGIRLFFYIMNIFESDPLFEINVPFWFKIFFESINIYYDEEILNNLIIKNSHNINHLSFNEDYVVSNIKPRTIDIENQKEFWELKKELNNDFYKNFAINSNLAKFLELSGKIVEKAIPIPINVFSIYSITKELLLSLNALLGEDWTSAWQTNRINYYINFKYKDNWKLGDWNPRNKKLREYFKTLDRILNQADNNESLNINDLLILLGSTAVHYRTKINFFDKIIEHIWMKNKHEFSKNGSELYNKIKNKIFKNEAIENANFRIDCLNFLPKPQLLNNGFIIQNKNIKYTWISYYAAYLNGDILIDKMNDKLTWFSDEILYLLNCSDMAIWKGAFVKNLNDNNYRVFNNDFQNNQWRRNVYFATRDIAAPPILFLNTFYKDELFKQLYNEHKKEPDRKKIILKYDAINKTVFIIDNENSPISKGW
ncbi:Uncharacterised protein [Metamycoplasma cloacale]|uniref:Uncharacterized protein n=2 Tax=Metamycoplasma cloacale TaxID=92401 RepID=A0A2Z4LLP0_9BACT|nr:hypothetical protein DK849_01155 [Metamycoplasma cloacale]VEU79506.1 Uncharacterised protein [Metamycoplasma cloacale]